MRARWRELQEYFSDQILGMVPETVRATALLRGFGFLHVPLLLSLRPKVVKPSENEAQVQIPLNRWTRNHMRSMYFGTLAMGAECVAALLTVYLLRKRNHFDTNFLFKDFHADFLKRAEGDVIFVCDKGVELKSFIDSVLKSGKRGNLTVPVNAVLANTPDEVVAQFQITISVKPKTEAA